MQMSLTILNSGGLLFLTIVAMVYFLDDTRHSGAHSSLFHAFDLALPNSDLATTFAGDARVPSVPNSKVVISSTCANSNKRGCDVGTAQFYQMGSAGFIRNDNPGLPIHAFNVLHLIWTVSWFATPLSLLLLMQAFAAQTNNRSDMLEKWWWLLYAVITIWNITGVMLQILLRAVPIFNIYMVIASALFSSICAFALREVWRDTWDNDGQNSVVWAEKPRSSMRLSSSTPRGTKSVELGASEDVAIPGLRRSYGAGTVLLLQYLFVLPIFAMCVFLRTRQRPTYAQMQSIYWAGTLLVSSVVLLQRSQQLGLTDITNGAFVLLGVVAALMFGHAFVPVASMVFSETYKHQHLLALAIMVVISGAFLALCILGELLKVGFVPSTEKNLRNWYGQTIQPWQSTAALAILCTSCVLGGVAVINHDFCSV